MQLAVFSDQESASSTVDAVIGAIHAIGRLIRQDMEEIGRVVRDARVTLE